MVLPRWHPLYSSQSPDSVGNWVGEWRWERDRVTWISPPHLVQIKSKKVINSCWDSMDGMWVWWHGVFGPIWRVIWMFYRMNGINNKPAAYFLAPHTHTHTHTFTMSKHTQPQTHTQCESVWWFPAAPLCRMRNICLILTGTYTCATPPGPHT